MHTLNWAEAFSAMLKGQRCRSVTWVEGASAHIPNDVLERCAYAQFPQRAFVIAFSDISARHKDGVRINITPYDTTTEWEVL